MATALRDFPQFDPDRKPTSIAQRYGRSGYIGRFENLIIAPDIKQSKREKALLLHCAGPAVLEIADTLPLAAPDVVQADDYDATFAQLNGCLNPRKNQELSARGRFLEERRI